MALQAVFDARSIASRRVAMRRERREHDLAPLFWGIATPVCLLFWAAVAYGIHSAL